MSRDPNDTLRWNAMRHPDRMAWVSDQKMRRIGAGWETIDEHGAVRTQRMIVPGGWVVKHVCAEGVAMVWVPDPESRWLLAEAIKAGKPPFDRPPGDRTAENAGRESQP